MPLADDVRAQHRPEQVELRAARRRLVDRRPPGPRSCARRAGCPSVVDPRLAEVAELVLEPGQLADAVLERGAVGQRVEARPEPRLGLAAAGREHLLDQALAADLEDRRQQPGREAVVVRGEQGLGVGRDVVQVARTADAVADGASGSRGPPSSSARSCCATPLRLAPMAAAMASGADGPARTQVQRGSRAAGRGAPGPARVGADLAGSDMPAEASKKGAGAAGSAGRPGGADGRARGVGPSRPRSAGPSAGTGCSCRRTSGASSRARPAAPRPRRRPWSAG